MQVTDLTPLSPAQRDLASKDAWADINAHDSSDRAALEAILPATGWFTISKYGKAASDAAWSVVQHQTTDPGFMAAMLGRMEEAAERHDVDSYDYALLSDRVAMLQHKDQSFGSQFVCRDHHWIRYSLHDPDHVDDRRKALGLLETEEQIQARIATYPPCYFAK